MRLQIECPAPILSIRLVTCNHRGWCPCPRLLCPPLDCDLLVLHGVRALLVLRLCTARILLVLLLAATLLLDKENKDSKAKKDKEDTKDEKDTTRAYSSKTSKRAPAKKDKKKTLEKRKRTTSKGAPDEKDEKDAPKKAKKDTNTVMSKPKEKQRCNTLDKYFIRAEKPQPAASASHAKPST